MKGSRKKSKKHLDELWKEALRIGKCPFAGCSLSESTCDHLDNYLNYDGQHTYTEPATNEVIHKGPSLLFTDDIDDFTPMTVSDESNPVWRMYKRLRKYPLSRSQIGILVRKFGAGMTNRQILADMGWTSHSLLHKQFTEALKILRNGGFGR